MKTAAPFVRIVTKNVRNVLMTKSAADVISVRIVWGAMETSVTTAVPVSVVRNMFATAATDAPNVRFFVQNAENSVKTVQMPYVSIAENVSIVQRQTAFVRNVINVLIVPTCLVPAD